MNDKGMIFDISRTSFVDGPGLRTTVFFKGCNLRCKWCHNPEGISGKRSLVFYADKCVGCGRCREVCENESCILCGKCESVCQSNARRIVGKEYTAEELLKIVRSDKPFYADGGGVTFSGGECMLQADFVAELARRCAEEGIETAIDTAGNVDFDEFMKVMPFASMFLYDIKCVDEGLHREFCGASNKRILENIRKISEAGKRIWVRVPIVPGFNAKHEEVKKIADFLAPLNIERVELLPYHRLGASKRRAMGMEAEELEVPSAELMQELERLFE